MWLRNWLLALFLVVAVGLGFCVFAPSVLAFQVVLAGMLALILSIIGAVLFLTT